MDEERILGLIYEAVDELNEQLDADDQLSKSRDAIVFGEGSRLDSLAVVNLLAAIEDRLAAEGGPAVALLDLVADEDSADKLRSIDSLLRTLLSEGA